MGEIDFVIVSKGPLSALMVSLALTGVMPAPDTVAVFVISRPGDNGAY